MKRKSQKARTVSHEIRILLCSVLRQNLHRLLCFREVQCGRNFFDKIQAFLILKSEFVRERHVRTRCNANDVVLNVLHEEVCFVRFLWKITNSSWGNSESDPSRFMFFICHCCQEQGSTITVNSLGTRAGTSAYTKGSALGPAKINFRSHITMYSSPSRSEPAIS